jgi:hypothetical protein
MHACRPRHYHVVGRLSCLIETPDHSDTRVWSVSLPFQIPIDLCLTVTVNHSAIASQVDGVKKMHFEVISI